MDLFLRLSFLILYFGLILSETTTNYSENSVDVENRLIARLKENLPRFIKPLDLTYNEVRIKMDIYQVWVGKFWRRRHIFQNRSKMPFLDSFWKICASSARSSLQNRYILAPKAPKSFSRDGRQKMDDLNNTKGDLLFCEGVESLRGWEHLPPCLNPPLSWIQTNYRKLLFTTVSL